MALQKHHTCMIIDDEAGGVVVRKFWIELEAELGEKVMDLFASRTAILRRSVE